MFSHSLSRFGIVQWGSRYNSWKRKKFSKGESHTKKFYQFHIPRNIRDVSRSSAPLLKAFLI